MPSFEAQGRRGVQRLEALWRIVNRPNLHGDDLVLAMLAEAAASMRPGHAYAGSLGHIEGSQFVLDAVAGDFGAGSDTARNLLPREMRIERSDTLHSRDLDAGRTQSWEDCQTLADLPERTRASGIRSQITTQFATGGTTHILTLGSLEPPSAIPFGPDDYTYIELLGSFFARHFELEHMQHSLVGAELRARRHAERLEALWQIANNPTLRGEEQTLAMLRVAASAIRPAQYFRGQLGRIEDDEIVVISVGVDTARDVTGDTRLKPGQRKPLAQSIVPRDGRTQAWEDIAALDEPPAAVAALGWRAVISTLFDAAGAHYVLTFASAEPAAAPFSADDLDYVNVLASSFAHQLEVDHLEVSLSDEEARSRQHAERLEALWQIANNPTLQGEELTLAMLRQAAAGVRPGQRFRGLLGRIEGDETVVIGVGLDPDDDPRVSGLRVGRRSLLSQTIIPRVGRTQAWEDLTMLPDLSPGLIALGWRAVISTQFGAGGSRYSLTFASPEPAAEPFSPADLAYLDVLASSFAKQLEVNALTSSLRQEEEHSRFHAERLASLWTLVNDRALGNEELIGAMLRQATEAVRQHQDFRGMLWRIQGTDMVVEALAHSDRQRGKLHTHVGAVVPLDKTIVGKVAAEGTGIRSWDDIQTSSDASAFSIAHATHSLIVTTFIAGATTWGLSFASDEIALRPLSPQDYVYIDILTSFFANHVQQRWQFERIQYHYCPV